MSEKFNTSGVSGRDCPICMRVGTLAGERAGDAPTLTCTGCQTVFTFVWGDGISRDTLTRIREAQPRRVPQFELYHLNRASKR